MDKRDLEKIIRDLDKIDLEIIKIRKIN